MKFVWLVVGGATLAVALLLAVAGFVLPNQWRVQRTLAINASPETIHRFVGDLRRWPEWADRPELKEHTHYEYSDPSRGVGARRSFSGKYSGDGVLTITSASVSAGIHFSTNTQGRDGKGAITYSSNLGSTDVTWKDEGQLPPIIGGFIRDDMQQQLGSHFEKSLERLKALAENAERAAQ